MQQHVEKHVIAAEIGHIKKVMQDRKMARARYGQKLRDTLNEAEDYGVQYAHIFISYEYSQVLCILNFVILSYNVLIYPIDGWELL